MSKPNTPNKIGERMSKYLAAAGAVAGITSANAQIIYTDVTPDVFLDAIPDSLHASMIDINNDGTPEFSFGVVDYSSSTPGYSVDVYGAFVQPASGVSWLGVNSVMGTTSTYVPMALNTGAAVSQGATGWSAGSLGALRLHWQYMDSTTSQSFNFGKWNNVVGRYMGVRFNVSGDTLYGWVRFNVGLDGKNITLRDYAYRVQPNLPINAGQMPTSVNESDLPIGSMNGSVHQVMVNLYNEGTAKFELMDLSGKVVHTETLSNSQNRVSPGVSTGIYIARLEQDGKHVVKKIYLH